MTCPPEELLLLLGRKVVDNRVIHPICLNLGFSNLELRILAV